MERAVERCEESVGRRNGMRCLGCRRGVRAWEGWWETPRPMVEPFEAADSHSPPSPTLGGRSEGYCTRSTELATGRTLRGSVLMLLFELEFELEIETALGQRRARGALLTAARQASSPETSRPAQQSEHYTWPPLSRNARSVQLSPAPALPLCAFLLARCCPVVETRY